MGFISANVGRLMGSTSTALAGAQALLAGETQGLAFDFTDSSAYIIDTGTPANNYNSTGIVSNGSLVGPSGKLTYTSPSNKLTLQSDGFLRYQAHNLCLQSEDISNASWTKNGGSAVSVSQFTEDTSTGEHRFFSAAFTTVSGGTYKFSCEVSVSDTTSRSVCLRFVSTGVQAETYFNLETGAISSTASGSATITDVGGGVYRCTITGVAGGATGQAYLNLSTTGNAKSYTGDGVQTLTATKMHVYRYPANTDYIKTTTAAKYALPIEYDTSGTCLGLLVEEARTNLATYSTPDANWVNGNSSDAVNSSLAPNGLTHATSMIEDSTVTSFHYMRLPTITVSAATDYSCSIYAKYVDRQYITISLSNLADATDNVASRFDIQAGTIATSGYTGAGGGATHTATYIESVGNGWFRCTLVGRIDTTSAYFVVGLAENNTDFIDSARGQDTYTGDGSSSVLLWGAQVEAGSFPTSPVVTYGSAATRNVDNISIASTAFPWSGSTDSVYAHFTGASGANTTAGQFVFVMDGTQDIDLLSPSSASQLNARASVGGSCVLATSYTGAGLTGKVAIANAASDLAASYDGGTVVTDTSNGVPGASGTFYVGSRNGTAPYNGIIKAISYVPRRKTDAELQAETA